MEKPSSLPPSNETFDSKSNALNGLNNKNFFHSLQTAPIDESPDFYDPYSELNLFLINRVKQEMKYFPECKKWSAKLQQQLIDALTPEFQKKFPKFRLADTVLKKTWEKLHYFSHQIQQEKQALTQDGKLNIHFLIKENLRSFSKMKNICQVHPYHYAHQLALKMSECIVTVDGTKPKLLELTQLIWSMQKHLIPQVEFDEFQNPQQSVNQVDKFIVQLLLQFSASSAPLSQKELASRIRETLLDIKDLAAQEEEIKSILSSLISRKNLLGQSNRKEQILDKIPYRLAQCLEQQFAFTLFEDPTLNLQNVIERTASNLKHTSYCLEKEKWAEIENKIYLWSMQGEMIYRSIKLNNHPYVLQLIQERWIEGKKDGRPNLPAFVATEICGLYLKRFPAHSVYYSQLLSHVWALLKYSWYRFFASPQDSSFDCFIKWHAFNIANEKMDAEQKLLHLEDIAKKSLPLIPFDRIKAAEILSAQK